MKIYPFFFQVSLAFTLFLITANVGRTQSGNMSDITQPNPIEITNPNSPIPDNQTPSPEPDVNPQPTPPDTQPPETPTAEELPQGEPASDPDLETDNQGGTDPTGKNQTASDPDLETDNQGGTDPTGKDQTASDPDLETDPQTSDKPPEETEADPNAEKTDETDPQSEEEEVAEKETETEEEVESAPQQEVNRLDYEIKIQGASTDVAVQLHEEFQVTQLVSTSGVQLYGEIPSVDKISHRLGQLWQQTGTKPAFINVSVQSNQLETFVVLPTGTNTASKNNSVINSSKNNTKGEPNNYSLATPEAIRQTVQSSSRKEILKIAKRFREEVSNSRSIGRSNYLESAQKLYQWIIEPLEAELAKNDIDILVFSMDSGLSLIPIAALHDGKQFLVEKYAVAVVPSFGLTDTRYVNTNQSPVLAMGASQFADQAPLPTMSLELLHATQNPRQGEVFLNEEFTVNNFIVQNRLSQQSKIIHLGTHAEFKAGDFKNSYIQFSDRKLKLPELMTISDQLGWSTNDNTPIELLVLSACETALGDEDSELGFAGLAVQAGVKSALASLWYISDLGTLALMSEFYDNLSDNLVKAEALRATQLSMLRGEVKIQDRELVLSNGESVTLPSTFPQGSLTLSDPYFWSAFTLIGNWN